MITTMTKLEEEEAKIRTNCIAFLENTFVGGGRLKTTTTTTTTTKSKKTICCTAFRVQRQTYGALERVTNTWFAAQHDAMGRNREQKPKQNPGLFVC